MILPSKHLPIKKSLIGCGAHVVSALAKPKSLERLWREMREQGHIESLNKLIATIDVLYLLGIVEANGEKIRLVGNRSQIQ